MADPQMDISLIIAAMSNIVSSLSFFYQKDFSLNMDFFPKFAAFLVTTLLLLSYHLLIYNSNI